MHICSENQASMGGASMGGASMDISIGRTSMDTSMGSASIVGRFAPSPTGRMHIGNIYSALAAWLAARSNPSNRFILRMEDNDYARSPKDADSWIKEDLEWLGLTWDGDIIYQSKRSDIYQEALEMLKKYWFDSGDSGKNSYLDNGSIDDLGDGTNNKECAVYKCYCSRTKIHSMSAPQESDGFYIYSGLCRNAKNSGNNADDVQNGHYPSKTNNKQPQHSWRLAMPRENSPYNIVRFEDHIYGSQTWNLARDVGDVVIQRADGIFGYQLAVVIDDYLQGVNQIVRGRDLIRSTAAQIWIRHQLHACGFFKGSESRFSNISREDKSVSQSVSRPSINVSRYVSQAVSRNNQNASQNVLRSKQQMQLIRATQEWTIDHPFYAHVPLLRNAQGVRLAKRDKAIEIAELRDAGVSPEEIIGQCAYLLGIRETSEPISAKDLIPYFSCDAIKNSQWGTKDRVLTENLYEFYNGAESE